MGKSQKSYSEETHCVHHFNNVEINTRGLNTPVEPASAFKYQEGTANTYPRYYNTINQKVICSKIAALEKTEEAIVFSSGMAAIATTMFSFVNAGEHIVFYSELYGGTYNLIFEELDKRKISYSVVEEKTAEAFKKNINRNTKVIYFETPTNPLLSIVDIDIIASVARDNNIVSIIDNTFASPINQNPAEHGIDLVIHSGTKYLGGHSDLSFGAVAGKKDLIGKVLKTAINYGGNLNPLDCYLIERSLKTLDVRVKRQNENALAIANFLQKHDLVETVYYPGLQNHPMHKVAKKQMKGFGGMLSFELTAKSEDKKKAFLDSLEIVAKALSLGGVESNICAPSDTSHIKMSREDRLGIGVSDNLLRLSVGIENTDDLINDLEHALEKTI